MKDQAEGAERMVLDQAELKARMEADAKATADALIQGYIGPDHKITAMSDFHDALVQALKAAREQGQIDCSGHMGIM